MQLEYIGTMKWYIDCLQFHGALCATIQAPCLWQEALEGLNMFTKYMLKIENVSYTFKSFYRPRSFNKVLSTLSREV